MEVQRVDLSISDIFTKLVHCRHSRRESSVGLGGLQRPRVEGGAGVRGPLLPQGGGGLDQGRRDDLPGRGGKAEDQHYRQEAALSRHQ